jgi:hypothetical protein
MNFSYPEAKALMHRFSTRYIPEPNSGCWLWTGAVTVEGYGRLRRGRGDILAHRLSYLIHCGPIPSGAGVLHSCDMPSCVNPDHLRAGSQADNAADIIKRGRFKRGNRAVGSQHVNSKLTEEQVLMARSRYAGGAASIKEMARELGVNHKTLRYAILGVTWSFLK